MVKISKSKTELDSLADKHYQILNAKPFTISERIDNLINLTSKAHEKSFFNFLKANLLDIIVGAPSELSRLNKMILPLYQRFIAKSTQGEKGSFKRGAIKRANDKVFSIFCYDDFISKSDGHFAYNFTESLGVSVCLYCNRQYIFTLYTSDGKCRPTLDHFLDKATHPYFAVSFYNLIPSCYVCNASLKNQQTFSLDKNLHPFIESMTDVLRFTIDIKAVDFISGKRSDFGLDLSPEKGCTDTQLIARAKENATVFKIKELYQGHKDYVAEIIKKSIYYNKSKINELHKFKTQAGTSLFSSKEEVLEFALGNFINEEKIGKRVLAKLTRDLAKDLGMTKYI